MRRTFPHCIPVPGLPRRPRQLLSAALFACAALFLFPALLPAAEGGKLKDDNDKLNYSVGYQIGGDFAAQGVKLSAEALVQGVADALEQREARLPQDEMKRVLVELQQKIVNRQKVEEQKKKERYREASGAFIKENAKKEGVQVLSDGVQYKVLKEGTGKKPTAGDTVQVHYRVTRVDGKEIASTLGGAPRTVKLPQGIPALREVLPLMKEGSTCQIVIPTPSAGGRDTLDDLGAVIYEVELIAVVAAQ